MPGLNRNGSPPPPKPKSPPQYPDLYGKRRELARVQILEREIGFLEEELKSVEGIPAASRSCKEVADFVIANADPLIPTIKKTRRSCRFWKWLCGVRCCNCSCDARMPQCCKSTTCDSCSNPCRNCCGIPKCKCFFPCWSSQCCNCKNQKCSADSNCCCCSMPECQSCPTCSCRGCCSTSCYPKCPNLNICSCCHKSCCFPCYNCM